MGTSTRIDTGGPNDAGALATFASRAFIDMYGKQSPPGHVQEYVARAFGHETVRRELSAPGCVFLLARSAGIDVDGGKAVLGYVKLCRNQPIDALDDPAPMQLERIYVDGNRQSGGLGASLLDGAIRVARNGEFRTIWLSVWQQNERAQQFYARNGFEIVGKTHFVIGPERQEDFVLARRLG